MSTNVTSECHLPLIVIVLARASIFVDNRVNEFIAYIAVCVGLAAVIPLLRFCPLVFSAECACRTHLDTHQTLRIRLCTCIPSLVVLLLTLTGSRASEIEIYYSIPTVAFSLIISRELGQENELLGSHVTDGGERFGAYVDTKVKRFPVTRQGDQLKIQR
jgi:hypothetical protein